MPWRIPGGHRTGIASVLVTCLVLATGGAAQASPGPAPAVESTDATCTLQSGLHTTFESGGDSRTFLLQVPPGADAHTPMVVSIHPADGNARDQQTTSGFQADRLMSDPTPIPQSGSGDLPVEFEALSGLGMQEGFITAFPQARPGLAYYWDAAPGSVDIDFVTSLTEHLHRSDCSSPEVTSINGLSMGAMMTSRLMCVRPDLYSGAAMIAGVLPPLTGCEVPPNREILVIHGRLDPLVPFDGTLPPMLVALAGPGAMSAVDRVGIAAEWARAKDCPSPGWTTAGTNAVTDLSCPRSATFAVAGAAMSHTWDAAGINTSRLIWAVMRPDRPCTVIAPTPANPAMAQAIAARLAGDIAFRIDFGRIVNSQMTCNPALRQTVINAIATEIRLHPNGMVAQQITFAIREVARTGR